MIRAAALIIIEDTVKEICKDLFIAENDPKEQPGNYAQIAHWIEKKYLKKDKYGTN